YPNKRPRLDFNNIPLDLNQPLTPLLKTDGLSWDYQESPKLEEELRVHVQDLYSVFKKNRRDKSNTLIFFMVSGAGCGKSRNATEIPKTLCKIFVNDLELRPRLEDALIFAITFENGTKSTCLPKLMQICANQKNVALKELTVILIVDGLQTTLINENDATLVRPFHQMVADSHQKELQSNDGDLTIPPGCQFWQHFEHFIASFHVLKSNVFETDEEIKLQDIHADAKHHFGTATIRNVLLSLKKAIWQESTKSSAYSTNKMVTCKRGDNQINFNLENASACIINGSSASFGDSFCLVHFANSPQLYIESHQTKCLKSQTVSQQVFNEEYEKASDKDDIFLLYTCGSSNVTRLSPLSAIVDCDCWKLYFGPFAEKAFLLV
ncbi:2705_t:CDS:2, partial [Funneliformis caledonium]